MSVAVVVLVFATGCGDDEGRVRVESLAFEGNEAFADSALAVVFQTRATSWWPWARARYFDQAVFEADLAGLVSYYARRGYPDAVVTERVEYTETQDAVRLTVTIDEGDPVRIEGIEVRGVDGLSVEADALRDEVQLEPGAPRDTAAVARGVERIQFLLRDGGYARARVTAQEEAGTAPRQTVVIFDVNPGPATTFGEISVSALQQVDEGVVRRSMAFRTGEPFRESQVLETQRRLAGLGLFDFAHVGEVPDRAPDADPSTVPMLVTLTEARPTLTQIGLGFGSEDGPRGSLQWQHLNFLGGARQFSIDSKYSVRLRGLGVALLQPDVRRNGLALAADASGWWTDEPAYTSRAIGGRLSATLRAETGRGRELEPVRRVGRLTYLNENLRYTITPEALANPSLFDELIALGLDPITGEGSGRLAALDLDLELIAVDVPLSPRSGHAVSLHVGHAAPWLGSTFRYDEVSGEVRQYLPLGESVVLAARAHAAGLFANGDAQVPFSERYFLGGASSLRGWGRFQVSPLTADGLPIGGRALVELSTELRFPLRGALSGAAFVDAGNVWSDHPDVRLNDLRVAVGPGVRWSTPFGVVRADFGVQVNRIPGLRIDGEPERRRWRVHFSFGQAF